MCRLIFKFMLKIAYLTLWTLTFWKDFGPVFSYCHTVAFSANRKGLKAAPVNRPTRKKKRQHGWLTASLEHIYAHLLEQYCYLLAFKIVPSIPQHPLVASKRKSTKHNIAWKRKKKKGMQSSILQQQTTITNPSVHSGSVSIKKKKKKHREKERLHKPSVPTLKRHILFFSLIRVINLSSLSIP